MIEKDKRGHAAGWSVFEQDGSWQWVAHANGAYTGGNAATEDKARSAAQAAYDGLIGKWVYKN